RTLPVAFAVLVALVTVSAQPAAPPQPRFTADELMDDVTTLAAPAMEGRRTGTPGNVKAREWLADRFRQAGLEPLGNGYRLPFTFERRTSGNPATGSVTMEGVNLAGI